MTYQIAAGVSACALGLVAMVAAAPASVRQLRQDAGMVRGFGMLAAIALGSVLMLTGRRNRMPEDLLED